MPTTLTRILVVDDSPVERRLVGDLLSRRLPEAEIVFADNDSDAAEIVDSDLIDLILADVRTPTEHGLEFVEQVRAAHPDLPVILMTGGADNDLSVSELEAGQVTWISRHGTGRQLIETVRRVLAAKRTKHDRCRLLGCLVQSQFRFELSSDVTLVPPLVEFLTEKFRRLQMGDEQTASRVSVCLYEALTNAINHGNFELDSALREGDDGLFDRLADERQQQLPYSARRVFIEARFSADEARFVIRDEGAGFNHGEPTRPGRDLERLGGRGLLLIRAFMDEVRFNDQGNEITLIKRR